MLPTAEKSGLTRSGDRATSEDLRSVYKDDGLEERMRGDRDEEFTAFVAASAHRLRRTAFLLSGDWHRADDAVQSALIKLYLSWDRVRARKSMEGFVRTTIVRGLIDESRRPWRRELASAHLPDAPEVEQANPADGLLVRQMWRACHRGSGPCWFCGSSRTAAWPRPQR